jgi:error-prone DNA polymerase
MSTMEHSGVPYVPLCCHSYFSLRWGCLPPEEICAWAAREGMPAAALTDVENLYGLVRFITAAGAAGIKPVAGAVFPLGRSFLVAYCISMEGYARLAAILSRRFALGISAAGGIRGTEDDSVRTGAVCLAAAPVPADGGERCPRGTERSMRTDVDPGAELFRTEELLEEFISGGWTGLALASDSPAILERLTAVSRSGVYGALVYGRPFRPLARWAAERGVPLLPLNRARYITDRDRDLCGLLRAIGLGRTVRSLEHRGRPGEAERYASGEEMKRYFSACPEAFEHAYALAMRVETGRIISPSFVFPRFRNLTEEASFALLRARCYAGIAGRYGTPTPEVTARLEYELGIIRTKGFSAYFLVVHDIVRRCPRTCGRGSSASSIVSYLLGITHVDPIRYDLFFERFLNLGRTDPPDIDVDFPWDEREAAFAYVFETYAGRAGMVADHVTFADRACIRESAKALGLRGDGVERYAETWSDGETEGIPVDLLVAARMIRGLPWYIGTHPGGVVITPGPITDYTHVQPSPAGWPVIAWEKDAAEAAGLVKIDLLGNRSLGVLRDALELVNRRRSAEGLSGFRWESGECLDDPATRRFIESGETLGIFYIESPATRQLLRKMGTGDYPHLVVASSIIRPAANGCIREYLDRLGGKPWNHLHPLVRNTLAETFGVMVYQEDVSRIALSAAGFSPEEADRLRKVLSKKAGTAMIETFRGRFFEGAARRGLPSREIDELWEMILSFKGYSFCKAHSASYALVSYKLAHLKRLYPLEFFTAVINNGGGFYSTQVYLNAARRMGFPVFGPDVNASEIRYRIEGGGLRIGLAQVKGLSGEFLERLVRERTENGPYADPRSFLGRLEPDLSAYRMLVRSGALDSIRGELNRPQLFWVFYHLQCGGAPARFRPRLPVPATGDGPAGAGSCRRSRPSGGGPGSRGDAPVPPGQGRTSPRGEPCFRGAARRRNVSGELFEPADTPPAMPDYRPQVKLRDEVLTTGLVFSRFPIEIFGSRVRKLMEDRSRPPLVESRELGRHIGLRVSIAGTLAAGKEVETKHARRMCFVSFEDRHAVFETVLFPDVYDTLRRLITHATAFLVTGVVTEERGAITIRVEELTPLTRPAACVPAGRLM